ncbi:hypothetical protein [Corynebacterium flavescens]|uniref:hypothetical protein n=1 Tax=Corynebacterium flavescens TaxID=28028 RepID=UPI00289C3706|nr:hypothetical protein [Corynebacterium flavescens]
MKTNFKTELYPRLTMLTAEVQKTAGWYRANQDYSAEGRATRMQDAAKRLNYSANIADLRLAAQTLQDTVEAKYTAARTRLYPKASNPTEQLAAELAAQRVLARDINEKNAGDLLKELGATPARGIVVGELKVRGVLPQSVLDAFEGEAAPELQDAENRITAAGTAARLVEEQLQALENTIANPASSEGVDTDALNHVANFLEAYFSEDLGTEGPLTFQPIKTDKSYDIDPAPATDN